MNDFKINTIVNNKDVIGQELKEVRKEKGLSLENVSQKISIKKEYLSALEEGKFELLPKGVYGKNYLREYSRFLRLNTENILEMYDEIINLDIKNRQNQVFKQKVPKPYFFIIVPKLLKNLLLLSVVIICALYLGFYINNIISPPELKLFYPNKDITINENTIRVEGQTEKEVEVKINNQKVLLDIEGKFYQDISLRNGINTIIISSQKKYSQENIIERKVIVGK